MFRRRSKNLQRRKIRKCNGNNKQTNKTNMSKKTEKKITRFFLLVLYLGPHRHQNLFFMYTKIITINFGLNKRRKKIRILTKVKKKIFFFFLCVTIITSTVKLNDDA